MRPDWEVVTWQLVDWLESYAATLRHDDGLELDLQRIAVIVASMGGYYALRAASDARIKACVAIDPFYEWDCGTRHISGWFMNTWTSGRLTERTIDRVNSLWHGLEHTVAVGGRAHPSLLGHRAHGHYLARDEAVLAAGRVSGAWSTVPLQAFLFSKDREALDEALRQAEQDETINIDDSLANRITSAKAAVGRQMGALGKLHNLAVHIRASERRYNRFKGVPGQALALDNDTRWNHGI
ncbi:hypothetical protein POJ06DRAFT_286586 [Lipomyces tetrasporus]|uniref:AB hydrolase-1 domain-containing protein n=1 Tax=Lipomyces tetrasporus TaxID=54092 RepID=A0AAD7QKZ1_9ASCO|nr:uncharacterized protein POJ06DRAFT_286586 [Lipomyces tetrasporus]KAJ8097168.1 hypothetical protein POJ06DRAFT_286586 [Lipomyces tetrasporus]